MVTIRAGALVRAIVLSFVASLAFFSSYGVVHAVQIGTAASLTTSGQTIKASSNATAIMSFNIATTTATLSSISISLNNFAGFSATSSSDLAALGTATSSGIAIYRDNKATGTSGSFDSADVVVLLSGAPAFSGATTTLTFAAAETPPADDTTGNNPGADYFLVVKTSSGAVNAHAFSANIYPGQIVFNTFAPPSAPVALTTNQVTLDTVLPTLDTSRTGPQNNSTGVPISMFPHLSFSENLDQTTLSNTNITLSTGGTAVGAAIRPFPDGFDLILSSPPTFSANTRFAKVNVATGFFNVQGSSTIIPQGTYSVPAAGDIVYTQFDTFPPDVGIVTNSTLTSGVFAVNAFPLFRPSQLTKFAAATKTGYYTDAATVGVGDLVVANTSANPTGNGKYGWHIVTTAQAINNASLRLDGQGGQPTYATSTFSSLMPAATSTISSGTLLNATTTFTQGDLVFANLEAGGDNLGSYAWHLVTTTQVVDGVQGPGAGTTTSLRFDSSSAPPTFTASSVLAKVAATAQGATGGAVPQDATVFTMGDLMFAKVTANAANTNAYAFHLVSNPGTGATSTTLRLDNNAGSLDPSTTYVVSATTTVTDPAGNGLAAPVTITFTTGSTGTTNTTPPFVQSSQPQMGSQSFAPNAPIKLTFSVAMNSTSAGANSVTNTSVVKLSTAVNGTPGTQVAATNAYDALTNTVTITPSVPPLTTSTDYVVQVSSAAQSATGAPMPVPYMLFFRTGSAVDTTPPTILGVSPAASTANVSLAPVLSASFSEDMSPSTITTTTVTLVKASDNSSVASNVTYNPSTRTANLVPSVALLGNTSYSFVIKAGSLGVKDSASVALLSVSTTTFTTSATADTAAPSVAYASADNFGVAVTFSEQVKTGGGFNAADNVANYTLESPSGTTIALGGKTVTYDPSTKTARISGLSLQNGSTFKVTVAAPVQDLASNGISTSGTPAGNLAFGTVQNSSMTGGNLGPGTGTIDQSVQGMNPTRVTPAVRAAGQPSNYHVEFLAGTSIPATGQIVLTFPAGFTLSTVTKTATSTSFCNTKINGMSSGTTTMDTVVGDDNAGTVTITTAGSATGANAFVCFDLSGIINSSSPAPSGYQIDIKTRDTASPGNRAILETKTAAPFYLGAAGSRTLTVNVFNDGNANGAINANEGVAGVNVFLFSPALGGQATTTNASGVATFNALTDGDYQIGLDPNSLVVASSTVYFNSPPQLFTVSATNLTKNLIVSASSLSISGTITGTGLAATKIDVFAASQNGFSKKTITLTGGADTYSLPVTASTTYQLGVGPAMSDTAFIPGGPPPPMPTFNFMPPAPISISVGQTSVTGKNFVLGAASDHITGYVRDSGGNAVSNAGVFARPVATSTTGGDAGAGFGTGGMTGTDGSFSLNVTPGVYLVGVAKPGMPFVPDQQITVASGGNTPTSLTFKLGAASSLTIAGTVKDDSGNAVPYAGVSAHKITSTSDTSLIGGGMGNFVGGPTDANGAYTLYVSAGTWYIEAFAPGFGLLGSKTVTVTTSSLTGQDFSAQNLSLGTITGSTTQAAVGVQGVMVRADGSAGANMVVSDVTGSYSMKVPVGTYTVRCFFPGVGDVSATSSATVTVGGTITGKDCAMTAPITITLRLTDGTNPITNAFIDVRDSSGRGNGTSVSSTSGIYGVYSVTVPPGTYTVRAGHPAYGTIGTTAGVATTQTITYTATAGALFAISGTVTSSGTGVNGAWVSLIGVPTGQTNTINLGAQTDSSGAFTLNAPAGSYQIRADKPNYISGAATTLSVSAASTGNTITLSTAPFTIAGTVLLSGSGVSGAFVDATDGSGGYAVAQTDSSGLYSLPVKAGVWSIHARSLGYEGGPATVTITTASKTGQNISLSAISGFTIVPERQETVTPTSGGILSNSNIGTGFKLNIPANALGTGSNASTVKTQSNTGMPSPASGTILSKNAVTITAVDSSGQPIKNLNDNVTVVIPYDPTAIPSGKTAADLQIGVWNDATQSYDILSTTVDTTALTLTAEVSHFSDFAPIVSSTVAAAAAAAPTASSGGGGGGGAPGSVIAPSSPPRAQIIYPDGRIVYLDQMNGSETSATGLQTTSSGSAAASLSRGSAPSAGVSAHFTMTLRAGSRGSDVKRLQTLLQVEPTGYFGALTRAAVETFQVKYGIAKKGDSGFGLFGPKTRAKIEDVFGSSGSSGIGISAAPTGGPLPVNGQFAILAGGTFVRALDFRATGADVKTLQVVLNSDPDTQVTARGAGSPGYETTYFGVATRSAVQKFQEKYGIAKSGDPAFGFVGPKTRAKLNEILAAGTSAAAPAMPSSDTGGAAASATTTTMQTTSATSTEATMATSSTVAASSTISVMSTSTATTTGY